MPAAVPWVTSADMANRFGIRDPDDRDSTAIQSACAQACSWMEFELGRRVLASTYIRRFSGKGSPKIYLPALPIRRIVTVSVNETAATVGTADQAATDSTIVFHDGKAIRYNGGSAMTQGWSQSSSVGFPRGDGNIRVEWEAGYLASEIPAIIRGATEVLASIFWREKHRAGDKSKSSGRGSTSEYLRELVGADLKAIRSQTDWRQLYIDQGIPLEGDAMSDLGVFTLGDSELG